MRFSVTLLFCALLMGSAAHAQSCCKKPAGMRALALNAAFQAAHEAPLPFDYTPAGGSTITFSATGGQGSAFYVPGGGSGKVLILFHEWWGLNDYIKREAESWQKTLGVDVYAIDLYDGKVAATPDEAGKLMSALDPKRGEAIIAGLLAKIGEGKKIATLGWCMGGSWSFAGTLLAGNETAGCVMYYGFPEKDKQRIASLKADVLYIYGSQDKFIKEKDVKDFGKNVEATGHKFTLHSFDAVHAFANPSNPKYDAKAAEEAKVYALKFLKQKLSIR